MAQRRMFSLKIIDTDLFLDMPISTRLLYYDLCMRADDDGFVASPKKIMKLIGANDDDFKILFAKKYIIPFKTGICVVVHWKIHNYIQSDRYTKTDYNQELSMLELVDNKYKILDTKCIQNVSKMDKNCIQDVSKTDTQVRLGKVNINIDDFFKKIWDIYPNKKGKGAISKATKVKLFNIGLEQMTRAIERYKNEIKESDIPQKFIKHGSTFFNSGYIDYLDENFKESKKEDISNLYRRC